MEEALQEWQQKTSPTTAGPSESSRRPAARPHHHHHLHHHPHRHRREVPVRAQPPSGPPAVMVAAEADLHRAPDFQGYLLKLGRPPGLAFKRRWCELRGTTLAWFSGGAHRTPRGTLSLGACTLREDPGCATGLLLVHGRTPHFFRAGSAEERQAWWRF
eukprot:RCo038831